MKYPTKLITYLFVFLISSELYSTDTNSSLISQTHQFAFIENKGQMKDVEGNPTPYILYKAEAPGINIWITNTGITYQFLKLEDDEQENSENKIFKKNKRAENKHSQWNRVDMIFKNAKINKENCITEENSQIKRGVFNYYLAHCPDGVFDVKAFSKITIRNIYNGIDWILYTNQQQNSLKQDFIIHPNADPNQIKIIYEGKGKFEFTDNQIHFENNLGELHEGKLFCFREKFENEISSKYSVKKNTSLTNAGAGNFLDKQYRVGSQKLFSYEVSIQLGEYDNSKTLIIDPQQVWGTFYGGSYFEGSTAIATDPSGNLFIVGYTGSIDFPVLNGGVGTYFQATNGAGVLNSSDIIILKFSNTGAHRWTTYYGGDETLEQAYSVCTDPTGNVFITGFTGNGGSFSTFPIANPGGGAYFQNAFNGGEAFILKFGNNGNRIWATFYGGANSNEEGRCITSDPNGNIYVSGFTNSSNFPVLANSAPGSYNQATSGGFKDAFILKFSNTGIRQWATYFGGAADDDAYGLTLDISGNITITGSTKSLNLPIANPAGGAYYQNTKSGAATTTDAFFSKFNNTGILVWSTYYGGSQNDVGHSIKADKQGNIFSGGITFSSNFPVTNPGGGAYYQGISGSPGLIDSYIVKFSSTGVARWSTYFGGNNDDQYVTYESKTNVVVDDCDNAYLGFSTLSSNLVTQLACDGGYLDNSFNGYSDDFIAKFSNGGVPLWRTYLGGNAVDFRIALATDFNNNLFVTGEWSGDTTIILTPATYPLMSAGAGNFYDASHNGDDDLFVLKFKPTIVSASATFTNSNCCSGTATLNGTGGCAPYQYLWYDSNWNLVGNTQTANKLCAGTYYGVLRDSISCSLGDTATVSIIELGTPPNLTVGQPLVLGCGTSSSGIITANSTTSGVSYSWTGPGIVSGNTNDTATVNATGTYTITVTDSNGCSSTGTVSVTSNVILPNVSPATTFTITCTTLSDTISATSSTSGVNYNWNGPGIVSGGNTSSPIVNTAGIYTVTVTDANSCTNTATVTVTIDTIAPLLTTGASLTIYCNPTQGIITANSSTAGATYSWNGSGIVSGNNNDTATVNAAGTYTVTVTDPATGCTKTSTVTVTSNTTPPNATPGPPITVSSCISFTDTITASSTTSGVTYNWSGPGIVSGGNTSSAIINALGTYTVTITDPITGCTNTTTVTVNTSTILPNVTPGPTLTITSCINISGNISANSTTPGATYNWSGPGIASGGNTSNPSINALGTYTVTVTDPSTGCTNTSTVLVNNNIVLPNVSSSPNTIFCNQTTTTLTATSTTSGATFSWTGLGIVSGGNTSTVSVNALGTYTVIVTDPNTGCTNSTTANVNPPAFPIASVSPNNYHRIWSKYTTNRK